ncbi:MAG TPA: PAAR-like domain-containing protein [Myxococcaceae bacterium]|nr:PAAR-like domain-containing protein [Myxococcaceae bacterium]
MSLIAMMFEIATESQALNFVGLVPNVCLVPAPPPPAGPQGIPAPFPITTDSSSIAESPADNVTHAGKKLMNLDSVASGIKGNEAGVGNLPPTKPEKDILTMVNMSKAIAMVGCPTVKAGGKQVVFVTSPGFGNVK